MQTLTKSKDTAYHLIVFFLCLTPVLLSMIMATDSIHTVFRFGGLTANIGIPCVFLSLTGYRCPACGMSRGFIYMSALDLSSAWHMNRAGVLLYLFCLLQLPYRLLRVFQPGLRIFRALVIAEAAWLILTGLLAVTDFALQFFKH